MKQNTNVRIVSLILALVMLLPLVSIPAFAEETEATYTSFVESFDGKDVAGVTVDHTRKPLDVSVQAAADGSARGDVFHMSSTPAAKYPYYLVADKNNRWGFEEGSYTVSGGKLSGTANGITVTNAVINTNSLGTAATTVNGTKYYVTTGEFADTYCGEANFSRPAKLLHPKVEGDGDHIYISFDLYLSSDFKSGQGIQGRAQAVKTSGTANLELFYIKRTTAEVASFERHYSSNYVYNTNATLTLGAWHTITYVVNRTTLNYTAFADGVLAYQATFTSKDGISTPLVINADTFALENNRLSSPSQSAGFFEVDNFEIRNTDDDGVPANIRAAMTLSQDFNGAALTDVTAARPNGASVVGASVEDAAHGDVLHMDVTPKGDAAYYLWKNNNNKWAISATPNADGTITGTANGLSFTNAVINTTALNTPAFTKTENGTEVKYYVDGRYADAYGGVGNHSAPAKLTFPEISFADALYTISFDIYLSPEFYHGAGFTGRITTENPFPSKATNRYARVELFRILPSGDGVSFAQHNNAGLTRGNAVKLTKNTWHTLTFVIDRETGILSAYANGVFAFQSVAYKTENDAFYQYANGKDIFPLVFQPSSLQFENNRGNGNLSNTGYVEIDNVKMISGSSDLLTHKSYSESFESQNAGYEPFDGFYSLAAVNTTVADNYGSLAWNIPNEGNANKSPLISSPVYTYATGNTLVYEADYFIEAEAKGRLQSQIHKFTANRDGKVVTYAPDTSKPTVMMPYQDPNNDLWLDLYQVEYTGNGYATFKFETVVEGEEAFAQTRTLLTGRWNNIATVIDLAAGSYDVYINGILEVEDVPFYRQNQRLTNLTIDANAFVVGKINRNRPAYAGNIQIDNIRIHQGNRPTMGAEDTSVYDFDAFKYSQGMLYTATANEAKMRPALLAIGSAKGDTALRLPLGAKLSENDWALLKSDGRAMLTGYVPDATDPTKGTLNGTAITLAPDANGVYWYTHSDNGKYRPVSAALAETAVGGDNLNVCRATQLSHGGYSYTGTDRLLVEIDYFIEQGSDGVIEVQFENLKTNGVAGSYLALFKIDAITGKLYTPYLNDQGKQVNQFADQRMKIGEWNNIKTLIDMKSGSIQISLNEEIAYTVQGWAMVSGASANVTNLEVGYSTLSMINVAKIARELSSAKLNRGAVYIDDVRVVADGEATAQIVTDSLMKIVDGASIRMKEASGTGIRFATRINEGALENVKALLGASDVRIGKMGTLIAPETYYETANALTHEALEALPVETAYADIPFGGAYFGGDAGVNLPEGDYMVGSLVNLRDYTRSFAAAGYLELIVDGASVMLYSDVTVRSARAVATAALNDMTQNWTEEQMELLNTFATEQGEAHPLEGLNVLAMGDSLFQGAQNDDGRYQWINVTGNRYKWNLTNLGIGGATISYDPNATHNNVSMYNLLFNNYDHYKFGSTDADNVKYYSVGNPSGNEADVDIILLQAGSNDYGSKVQAPLGTIGSTNPKEFLGAWKLVVDKLLEIYPNATVVMMTAWENNNQTREDGMEAIPYTSSVVGLYEALYADNDRVRLIDSGKPSVSGINMRDSAFKATYSFDAYHLNNEGMKIMATNMIPYLTEIVEDIKANSAE